MPGSRSLHMGLGMSRENGMSMFWGFTREGGYTRGQGRYTRGWEGARVYQSGSGIPRVEAEGWVHQIVAAGIPGAGYTRGWGWESWICIPMQARDTHPYPPGTDT